MFQVQKEAFKLTLKEKLDFEKDSFFSDRLLLTDHIVDYIYLKKKDDLELQKGEITSYSWNRVMKDLLF